MTSDKLHDDLLIIIQNSRLVGKADIHEMFAEAEGELVTAAEYNADIEEYTEAYMAAAWRIQKELDILENYRSRLIPKDES